LKISKRRRPQKRKNPESDICKRLQSQKKEAGMFDQETKDKFWRYVEKSPDPEAYWIGGGSKLRGEGWRHLKF